MTTTFDTLHADLLAALPALHAAAQSLWDNADVHPDTAQEACRMADRIGRPTAVSDAVLRQTLDLCTLLEAQEGVEADVQRVVASTAFVASFSLRNADLRAEALA